MSNAAPLYPLRFVPIYKEKVWGGRTLEKLGRELPAASDGSPAKIGESWEVADLAQSSVSGGGGGAQRSRVANGPLAGRTLHELMNEYGPALMGNLQGEPGGARFSVRERDEGDEGRGPKRSKPHTPDPDFPLLVKFLDARENLSVQVHPSAAYARTHPDAFLKSEAWYIIDRDPGAVIYKGVRPGVTATQFRAALESNAVEPLLNKIAVEPGQCYYLPSGTCHALGAGVLAAEVQTPSDTTFRVYDWGRTGRELHIEQAMQCIDFDAPSTAEAEHSREKPIHVQGEFADVTHLVACEHFRIDRVRMNADQTQEIAPDQPTVWMVLEGEGAIQIDGGNGGTGINGGTGVSPVTEQSRAGRLPHQYHFSMGQTLLLPPGMGAGLMVLDADTTWLEVTFPQARPIRLA